MMLNTSSAVGSQALTLDEFTTILQEIQDQPAWRAKADKEADYIDGNQLDTVLMRKQASLGIPPASENIMKAAIESVMERREINLLGATQPDVQHIHAAVQQTLGHRRTQGRTRSRAQQCGRRRLRRHQGQAAAR